MKLQLYHIKTKDDELIALWKWMPYKPLDKHVFLTHGTFSNKKICEGIAQFLVEKGFTCWIMEWRSHGESSKAVKDFNFETIAHYDMKSTFDFLLEIEGLETIDCVVHSGGGIILTMFLIHNERYRSKINSITLLGVQAFGAAKDLKSTLKVKTGKYIAALMGKVPSKAAGSTETHESYHTMKPWFDWNLNKDFIGANGFNYLDKMKEIRVPILSICAKGDRFIAPTTGCEKFLKAFKNKANQLLVFSKENGNLEDYNHSRILKSQHAKQEIFPRIMQWILQNENTTVS